MSSAPLKVIFDTDPGIDDAMALLYLHACDNLELLGITTILGNATLDDCTNNALFLCEQFGVGAPVFRGTDKRINGEISDFYPDFVHGKNGLADIDVVIKEREIEGKSACQFLVDSAKEHAGELTIIAVGRLTNIALAILQDDSFSARTREIIFMGGAAQCDGNVTPWAEANIIGDPEAAQIVFDSGIPLTMIGLDVTLQTRMSHEFLDALTSNMPDLKDLILSINSVYARHYKSSHDWDDFPVHDSSAVAFAHHATLFDSTCGQLTCVLEGEQRGRTLFRADESGNHSVCLSVNSSALLDDYLENTGNAYH